VCERGGGRERERERESEKAADSGREMRMVIVRACTIATAERKEVWSP